MALFYVDEDLAPELVQFLRDAGHDVEYAIESGHQGRPDAFHLRHAASRSAIVLTRNRGDFRFLHRIWNALHEFGVTPDRHSGILTSSRALPSRDWGNSILQLLQDGPALAGLFYSFDVQTGVWHRDRF